LSTEVLSLLDANSVAGATGATGATRVELPEAAEAKLLAVFEAAPDGRLHKLEAHQIARSVAPNARLVATLYKQDPPLLRADGDYRVITEAGRAWLVARSST
jgi:hypothetical protein